MGHRLIELILCNIFELTFIFVSVLSSPAGMPSGDALRALSDEELKTLEGMERANVEARIALLRDIQKLLDTAVAQLNQYSTVMAAMGYVLSTMDSYMVKVVTAQPCVVQGRQLTLLGYCSTPLTLV